MLNKKINHCLNQMTAFSAELKEAYELFKSSDKDLKRIFCLATERSFELSAEWLLRVCNHLYEDNDKDGLVEDKLAPVLGRELASKVSRTLGEKIRFGASDFDSRSLMVFLATEIEVFQQVNMALCQSDKSGH